MKINYFDSKPIKVTVGFKSRVYLEVATSIDKTLSTTGLSAPSETTTVTALKIAGFAFEATIVSTKPLVLAVI